MILNEALKSRNYLHGPAIRCETGGTENDLIFKHKLS